MVPPSRLKCLSGGRRFSAPRGEMCPFIPAEMVPDVQRSNGEEMPSFSWARHSKLAYHASLATLRQRRMYLECGLA